MLEKFIKVEEQEETKFQKMIRIFSAIATIIAVIVVLLIGSKKIDVEKLIKTGENDSARIQYIKEKAEKSGNINDARKVNEILRGN